MRSRTAPGGRYGRGSGTPFSKLLVLVLAGACLVFGYVYLYSPSSGAMVRRQALSAVRMHTGTEIGTAGASQTHQGETHKDDSSKLATSGSDASSGASTAHSTVQIISQDDPRHPKNAKQLISQASHHDEHQHDALDEVKQQHSDVSEHDQGEGAAAGGAAAGTAKDAKAAGGAAAGAGEGTKSAAGTPGVQNNAKVAGAGGAATQGTGTGAADASGATSSAADEHHEIDSGVKATAASLQHATEHLKEATELLTKQAAEVKAAAAGKGSEAGAAGSAGADSKAAAGSGAAAAGAAATGSDKKVAEGTANTPVAAATTNATTATTATTDAPGNATSAVERAKAKAKGPLPDLLAYSKEQGQPGDTIHVLFTSNGSPYQNIQARVMVGTYHMVRKMPGGEKLVAMTRILHRTTPDEVMDEIPTFRAQPLQPECDKWCWFPVADRANAVQQWVDAVHEDHSLVKAPWLLLLETDYVWMKPLLAMGSAYDPKVPGLAFRFDYIAPMNPVVAEILKEYCPDCDPTTVPGSGPAPVLMRFSDLRAATPLWEDLSLWIETHPAAKKQLGWVREMYAWDIGVAANKLNILTQPSGTTTLISQPPHDHLIQNATMFHYTWGCIVKDKEDKEVWKFDKRFYTKAEDALKLPTFVEPPEWVAGLHVHDGTPWTEDLRNTMLAMIHQMNLAVATATDLTATVKAAAAA